MKLIRKTWISPWLLFGVIALVACSKPEESVKGALRVPEPGTFENPIMWETPTQEYKPRYFCIHNHEYVEFGHGAVPLFYNDVGGRPIQCGKDAKL